MGKGMVLGSIVSLMTRVLKHVFGASSWHTWEVLFTAIFEGMGPLSEDDRQLVRELTGRTVLPTRLSELWLILGRRSGKTIMSALYAIWATCCRTYPSLKPGEVGVFLVLSQDKRQARICKGYISGLMRSVPVLERLIAHETSETIVLTSGIVIEVRTSSYRALRGFTCIGCIADELAFWTSEDSANPDKEVLIAVKAAMASVPEAMLVCITSPYARRGEAWRTFEKYFGKDTSNRVLVVNAATRTMNPTIGQDVIDAAVEDDPAAAAAEYFGQWRTDVESFLTPDAIKACVVPDRYELAPEPGMRHFAFLDPSGGSGGDSMTLGISRTEKGKAVLVAVRERKPPFSPDSVVAEFVDVLRTYGITSAVSDRFAGEWVREPFRNAGISVRLSDKNKSEIYIAAGAAINSGRVEILEHATLTRQLEQLERRTARGGRDSVDHPPGRCHDDVANAACGAIVLAAVNPRTAPIGFAHVPQFL